MKPYIKTGELTGSLQIDKKNTDEKGLLRNCLMLQEITHINDKAIMETFGHLNFSTISISRYHVYFHEAALSGDTLSISAAYTYSETGLLIEIKVHKIKTRKKITVLTGDFTFVNGLTKQNRKLQAQRETTFLVPAY